MERAHSRDRSGEGGLDPAVKPVSGVPVSLRARGGTGSEGAGHDAARRSESGRGSKLGC
jgi:hypothetical protein